MRALLAAINCPKGELDANLSAHLELIGSVQPGDLILLPEMSLTGYPDPTQQPEWLVTVQLPGPDA